MRARVVFVVLAHQLPDQVGRLLQLLLAEPASGVLLHYDGEGEFQPHERLDHVPRRSVSWGGMSIPLLFLDGMRMASEVDGAEWIVFLSGQDYPLRPVAEINEELLSSPHDVHMDHHLVREGEPWPLWEPLTRYGYGYRFIPEVPPGRLRRKVWRLIERSCQRVQRRAEDDGRALPWGALPRVVLRNVAARPAVGIRRADNPFARGDELIAGDAWFSIRTSAARQLLSVLQEDPAYTAYMAGCLVPDEAFFQSLIVNRLPELRVGPWRRHRIFLPGESHPHVWTVADLDELVATGADFARKFDPRVDAGVLDLIDYRILRR